ncbi:MAG: EAL domain-containing protein [Spirochaetes bacterium]|nr:EAL domain-containing protein [Spirochaetota bacterium]
MEIKLIELFIPGIGSGLILFGTILFLYLYFKTRISLYFSTFLIGLCALIFVGSEFFIIYIGGIIRNRGVGIYFHVLQQLGGLWFSFTFPLFIKNFLKQTKIALRINLFLIYVGFLFSLIVTFIAFYKPDLFISFNIPNDKWMILAANYSRGKEGILYYFRDFYLYIIILYFYIYIIYNISKCKNIPVIKEILIGLTISILAAIDDMYFVYKGRYIGFFTQFPFSRFSAGLIIFVLSTMITIINDFYKKALSEDKISSELTKLQEDFALISNNIDEVFWIYNKSLEKILFVSNSISKLWPFTKEELLNNNFLWKDYIFNEDRPIVETYLINIKHLEIIEYRIINKDKILWVRDKYYPIKGIDNEIYRWVRVTENITNLKEFQNELISIYYYDSLTKLKNRKSFLEKLKETLLVALRDRNKLRIVILIDIDNFSNINDKYGYTVGDELLIQFVDRVSKIIRKSDNFFRIGSDEFAIILGNVNDRFDGTYVSQKVLESVSYPFYVNGEEFFITLSIGISIYPEDGDNAEDIIQKAEIALNEAKKTKNSIVYSNLTLNQLSYKRLNIELLLKKTISSSSFLLYFQPICKINNEQHIVKNKEKKFEIKKLEVLLRMKDNNGNFIPPSEFIPIAETTNLINQIGHFVIEETCNIVKRYFYDKDIRFSINISGKQLEDRNFIMDIKNILEEKSIDPNKIEFEITESLLINNVEENINKLYSIKNIGIYLALDDFGTGYSSLARLKLLPFDIIKIDKTFINNIDVNNQDKEIVKTIINLSHSLNMEVVSEGVEKESQLEILRDISCDYFQGFYFSKPLPIENFLDKY